MPYTDRGIYYADTSTTMSVADITHTMADSIGPRLGVLQAVTATYSTTTTTTSTSYADSGLTASITPKSSTSKILVIVNMPFYATSGTGYNVGAYFQLLRGSTSLVVSNDILGGFYSTAPVLGSNISISYSDTPVFGSANVYKIQGKAYSPSGVTTTLNMNNAGGSAATSSITLLEISQ